MTRTDDQNPLAENNADPSQPRLQLENNELRHRLQELEDTLRSIHSGEVDALIVNGDIYTLESATASTNRLRKDVLNQMEDAVFAFDEGQHIIYLNSAAERRYHVSSAEVLGRKRDEVFIETDAHDHTGSGFMPLIADGLRRQIVAVHRLPDATEFDVESITSTLLDANRQTIGSLAVVRDVTDRRRAEMRRAAIASLSDCLRDVSNAAAIDQAAADAVNTALPLASARTDDDQVFILEVDERAAAAHERVRVNEALRLSELRLREANENLEAIVLARTQELMSTEQALRQSQKMEAVGQLTGGLAHDFNNLLAGIGASLQMLQTRLNQGKHENLDRYIKMGQDSVRRAAALTQRLLAFARRQTLDPKPTDLNRLIAGMEELIRRTVGPNVMLEVVETDGLWTTKIDPSQLENALLNLCLNARDAMLPVGGRLTIATANESLDEGTALESELAAGQYVSLSVTDTGTGMTSEVVKRVFDPFFTTKPIGQGTGLGLSMVYGFVRQSGGQVRVDSQMGTGTRMQLYLPRHLGDAPQESIHESVEEAVGGHGETVLLIEDETTIRVLITEVLEDAGYRVISAADGAAGLRVLQSLTRVDLLITDVGLPGGMNGRQVADAARVSLPNLKVLFITGYAENAAVGNGLLGSDMEVLTKPFEISLLARKVHEMTGKR